MPRPLVIQFSGASGEDFEQWLNRFQVEIQPYLEQYRSDAQDLQLAKCILVERHLTDAALQFFDDLEDEVQDDYDRLIENLRTRFQKKESAPSKSAALQMFAELRQEPGETIEHYVQRARLIHNALDDSEFVQPIVNRTLQGLYDSPPRNYLLMKVKEEMALPAAKWSFDSLTTKIQDCVQRYNRGALMTWESS